MCASSKCPLMKVSYTTTSRRELSLETYSSSPWPNMPVSFFLVDNADTGSLMDMDELHFRMDVYSTDVVALFCQVLFFNDWSVYLSNTTRPLS